MTKKKYFQKPSSIIGVKNTKIVETAMIGGINLSHGLSFSPLLKWTRSIIEPMSGSLMPSQIFKMMMMMPETAAFMPE